MSGNPPTNIIPLSGASLLKIEPNLNDAGRYPSKVRDGNLDFSTNQWTGYVTEQDFNLIGNPLALSPASPGLFGEIETALLILYCKKLIETERGQIILAHLMEKYLDTIGKVIGSIYKAGTQNWLSALCGNSVAVDIYARLGLMSPRDAMQKRAWIDHLIGNAYNMAIAGQTIDAVTTMVDQSSVSSHGEGVGESEKGLGSLVAMLKALK